MLTAIGNGVSRPLVLAPSAPAALVNIQMRATAAAIRTGMSHAGGGAGLGDLTPKGISLTVIARIAQTTRNDASSGVRKVCNRNVQDK
jgi:hypothetical protein